MSVDLTCLVDDMSLHLMYLIYSYLSKVLLISLCETNKEKKNDGTFKLVFLESKKLDALFVF